MSANSSRIFLFIGLALGLAVLVALAVPVIGEASLFITMLTPAIAVALMLVFFAPEGGLRAAIDRLGLSSAGLKGMPLAIGAPVAIFFVGTVLMVVLGLTEIATEGIGIDAGRLSFKFMAGLVVTTLLATSEEVGWRGYLLPRMMRMGAVRAMLAVGFLHGLWHMPLLLTTDYYHQAGSLWIVVPMFLATITLAGVFYGFLRIWTGSVWPVAVAHGAVNTAWAISADVSLTKSPLVLEYVGGESGIVMICGLLIIDFLIFRAMRSSSAMKVRA